MGGPSHTNQLLFLLAGLGFVRVQLFIRGFQSGVGSEPLFQTLIKGQMSSDPLLNPSACCAPRSKFPIDDLPSSHRFTSDVLCWSILSRNSPWCMHLVTEGPRDGGGSLSFERRVREYVGLAGHVSTLLTSHRWQGSDQAARLLSRTRSKEFDDDPSKREQPFSPADTWTQALRWPPAG